MPTLLRERLNRLVMLLPMGPAGRGATRMHAASRYKGSEGYRMVLADAACARRDVASHPPVAAAGEEGRAGACAVCEGGRTRVPVPVAPPCLGSRQGAVALCSQALCAPRDTPPVRAHLARPSPCACCGSCGWSGPTHTPAAPLATPPCAEPAAPAVATASSVHLVQARSRGGGEEMDWQDPEPLLPLAGAADWLGIRP